METAVGQDIMTFRDAYLGKACFGRLPTDIRSRLRSERTLLPDEQAKLTRSVNRVLSRKPRLRNKRNPYYKISQAERLETVAEKLLSYDARDVMNSLPCVPEHQTEVPSPATAP